MGQHLIIVLPGIGGSQLSRTVRGQRVPVWDTTASAVGRLLVDPGRLSLRDEPDLLPTGLISSARFAGFAVVPGYERLLGRLREFGVVDPGDPAAPVPDADVVAVPYDFRRSVIDAAEHLDGVVSARLAHLSDAEKEGKVVIVAHSMGGLVARAWAGLAGEQKRERWRWCRAIVTLGTPHRGAPKALDWLVNGPGRPGLRLPWASDLFREWPGMTELLPRYPAIRDTRVADGQQGAALYPHQLDHPGLGLARAAFDVHEEIRRAWDAVPQVGPETVAAIGWSHPTLDASYWDGERLRVTKSAPDWLDLDPTRRTDAGDGTVPSVSALPTQFDHFVASPIRLRARHIPLIDDDWVPALVRLYEGLRPPTRVRDDGDTDAPTLGLDVDEVQLAGEPIEVGVALEGLRTAVDPAQRITVSLRPLDGATATPTARVPLDFDAGTRRWRTKVPGQAPGTYAVRAVARAVEGAHDLECRDIIGVIEGDRP